MPLPPRTVPLAEPHRRSFLSFLEPGVALERDGGDLHELEHTLAVAAGGCEILTMGDRLLANSDGLRPMDVLAP